MSLEPVAVHQDFYLTVAIDKLDDYYNYWTSVSKHGGPGKRLADSL